MKLKDSVQTIPFIGAKYAKLLEFLGIVTLKDLLYYYPRSYIDSSKIYKYSELNRVEKRTTIGTLKTITSIRTHSKITIQKAKFELNNEILHVIWFNQPFLKDSLKKENTYLLFGKLNPRSNLLELSSPDIEELSPNTKHIGRISPVYQLTSGIKNKWLRARIKWTLDKMSFISDFHETLPEQIIRKYNLIGAEQALTQIHFPENKKLLCKARERLGFEELLKIQIKLEQQRRLRAKLMGKAICIDQNALNKKIADLKFQLTNDQKKALDEVIKDISLDKPMLRLLQGDVGSGKTIIAILVSFSAQNANFKTVYLAPTTILAEQVFTEYKKILKNKKIYLISSKSKLKNKIPNDAIIIGTHALLFQEPKFFENLNLLIVDEEHKFGVEQREALTKLESKCVPHKLSMTATPIPRSLAIAIWGDTDMSLIKSKPIGRQTVDTFFVPKSKITDSYKWIKEQIKQTKTQVFWVCPLISESEKLNAKSAEETYEKVKNIFIGQKVRLVHGKLKDKEVQIQEFKERKFDILVTTPIIEVGIDIPNANLIVIESAERFGLAQLHQFRGRVGRGEKKAYCLLFSTEPKLTEDQKNRLKYFCQNSDGLKLAEYDLKRRGPGEVYGVKQSGIPDLKIADIFDEKLLKKTQEAAKIILSL